VKVDFIVDEYKCKGEKDNNNSKDNNYEDDIME
jgi:hypothetical protein